MTRRTKNSIYYFHGTHRHKLRKARETLLQILTRYDRPSLILVPRKPCQHEKARVKRGEILSTEAAMNYGYIWRLHSTFLFDKEQDQWYEICNKPDSPKDICVRHSPFTFSEADKVEDVYFYDGDVGDMLRALQQAGWKLLE